MNSTLAYLRGRRAWMVEDVAVWGSDGQADYTMTIVETVGSDNRLGIWQTSLGGQRQEVTFSELVDNKGNQLPAKIEKPAVVVIPRGKHNAFIKAMLGANGFLIARSDADAPATTVDLLIFETGESALDE